MPKGNVKEKVEFKKYVGVGNFTPVLFNPSKEQLEEFLEKELDDEPDYTRKSADGKEIALVTVWGIESVTGEKMKLEFMLIDENAKTQDGKKDIYINQIGDNQSVADEADLFGSFKSFEKVIDWKAPDGKISKKYTQGAKPNEVENLGDKEYRNAKVGEREFYNFVQAWLSELKIDEPGASLLFDFDKLMAGNVSELQETIGSPYETSVLISATVATVDKDGETRQYQRISNKKFLPGKMLRYFKAGSVPSGKAAKDFVDAIKRDSNTSSTSLIHVYDPEKDTNLSDSGKVVGDDDISF